jgi:hypothetical protein
MSTQHRIAEIGDNGDDCPPTIEYVTGMMNQFAEIGREHALYKRRDKYDEWRTSTHKFLTLTLNAERCAEYDNFGKATDNVIDPESRQMWYKVQWLRENGPDLTDGDLRHGCKMSDLPETVSSLVSRFADDESI